MNLHILYVVSVSIVTLACSFILTSLIINYAIKNKIYDIPNERSSHVIPTPRGGGAAILLSCFFSLAILSVMSGSIPIFFQVAILLGGCVAFVSWLDDHGHVSVKVRLFFHCLAAALAIYWLDSSLGDLELFDNFSSQIFWGGVSMLFIVWMLNLFNFMDGIDGIASIEAITSVAGVLVVTILCFDYFNYEFLIVLLSAVIGFLYWNFPKSKIFMGDVGSAFLGYILAISALYSISMSPDLFWIWMIMLAVFVIDATGTLIVRLFKGEKIYLPHKSHIYQKLARRYESHVPVSLWVGGVNIVWLLPLSLLVGFNVIDGVVGLIVSYIPLISIFVYYQRFLRHV